MGPHISVQGRVDRSGVRGRYRIRGNDLTLAQRPGWTHSNTLKFSAGCCVVEFYAIAASWKGVFVRHIACRVTASLRASATLALRGPVLSAITFAQLRSLGPPRFRLNMAFAASNKHFLVKRFPPFEHPPVSTDLAGLVASWRQSQICPCT